MSNTSFSRNVALLQVRMYLLSEIPTHAIGWAVYTAQGAMAMADCHKVTKKMTLNSACKKLEPFACVSEPRSLFTACDILLSEIARDVIDDDDHESTTNLTMDSIIGYTLSRKEKLASLEFKEMKEMNKEVVLKSLLSDYGDIEEAHPKIKRYYLYHLWHLLSSPKDFEDWYKLVAKAECKDVFPRGRMVEDFVCLSLPVPILRICAEYSQDLMPEEEFYIKFIDELSNTEGAGVSSHG